MIENDDEPLRNGEERQNFILATPLHGTRPSRISVKSILS